MSFRMPTFDEEGPRKEPSDEDLLFMPSILDPETKYRYSIELTTSERALIADAIRIERSKPKPSLIARIAKKFFGGENDARVGRDVLR